MARSTDEIKAQMNAALASDPILSVALANLSSTAIYRLLLYIVAYSINIFEQILDTFKMDMEVMFKSLKPHTLYWYVNKAKSFQFGYSLPPFEDHYDNSGLTEAQVAASKIITQAACSKATRQNGRPYLRLKVAKGSSPNLDKLSSTELLATTAYFNQIADAGVDLSVESADADEMQMTWHILYDPQVIDASGNRITDGVPVIKNAIIQYLQDLPFNGRYYPEAHKDYVRHTEGVKESFIDNVQFKAFGSNASVFPGFYGEIPEAGWLKFYNEPVDLTIYFQPYEQ